MARKTEIKVGHTVTVDDSSNWYNKREVVIAAIHDGFCSVKLLGRDITFCLKNIHIKYMEYQD